jgi:hypothetical protein
MAREFDLNGAPLGDQFNIGGLASGAVTGILSSLADGGFAAVWQNGRAGPLVGQIYDANNQAVGAQFTVDNTNPFLRASPSISTLENGNFVVAWNNGNVAPTTSPGGFRIFSSNGIAVTDEININPGFAFPAFITNAAIGSVIALQNGGFAIPFGFGVPSNSFGETTRSEARFQIYSPTGLIETDQLIFAQSFGSDFVAGLAALPNGGLIATLTVGTSNEDILLQAFNANGTATGSNFVPNSIASGDQFSGRASVLSNGNLVVTWLDSSGLVGDNSGIGIVARLFDVNYLNQSPIARPDTIRVGSNNLFSFQSLLVNDSDPDRDTLSISSVSNVVNGSVTINQDRTFLVQRNTDNIGPVTFNYTITDGAGGFTQSSASISLDRIIDDRANYRGATPRYFDVVSNDFLEGYDPNYRIIDGAGNLYSRIGSQAAQLLFAPNIYEDTYFNLPLGLTRFLNTFYSVGNSNNISYGNEAVLRLQVEGWAQIGTSENDNLVGSTLPDHLNGKDGIDTLTGGGGDDWYTVESNTTTIVELANDGLDSVRIDRFISSFVLPANVENAYGIGSTNSATNLEITGNILDNQLTGNRSGVSILRGMEGNDTLIAPSSGTNGVASQLFGGNGDDTLIARGQSSRLSGGAGNDNIQGSTTAAATIQLGDAVIYSDNVGAVYVDIGSGFTNETALQAGTISAATQSVSQDRLLNIDHVVGSAFGDRIYGNGLNNLLAGGAGEDIIYAEGGTDTIDYSASAGAVYVDLASQFALETGLNTGTVSASTATVANDYIISFEDVIGSNFGDRIYGTNGANIINGGTGDDIIYGLGGDDRLIGGDGNDSLIGGGPGTDFLTGGSGSDRFYLFNEGNGPVDIITDFSAAQDSIWINLASFGLSSTTPANLVFGIVATQANTFLYNSANGQILYDADGAGTTPAVLVGSLQPIVLNASNFNFYGGIGGELMG